MEFIVYDKSFMAVGLADIYESVIWTERYNTPGDFEIYTIATPELVELFKEDYFVRCSESEYVMVIESVQLTTDVENGDKLIVRGRSLESILDRRIIIENMKFDSTEENPVKAWTAIRDILTAHVIQPKDVNRLFHIGPAVLPFSAITFDSSNLSGIGEDKRITDITISASYYGCSVLEAIESICQSCSIGFKMEVVPSFDIGIVHYDYPHIYFKLFKGLDLTYSEDNIYSKVIRFGPFFDNLISSDYTLKMDEYKNVAIVGGKTNSNEVQICQTVLGKIYNPNTKVWELPSGFNRRETYVDASNVSDKDETGQNTISDDEYRKRLDNEGYLQLTDLDFSEEFTAEIDPNYNWSYGNKPEDDYYLGDIVIIENNYGMSANARIIEVVRSEDTSGKSIIPTFSLETFSAVSIDSTESVPSDTEAGKGSGKVQ